MITAIIVLVIAYIIALLGLFHKSDDRRLDALSFIIALLLTAGVLAGVAKEVL